MKISIPQPCHENWNEMLPEEKGRFCLSCQKCVTDFTKMSDKEVINLLQKPNQCGRFDSNQLNRINFKLEQQNQFQFPRFFRYSSLFIVLGFGGTVIAQEKEKIEVIDNENLIQSKIEANEPFKIIKGQILDRDGFPVSDAFITLKGYPNLNTYSDENGLFELSVPNEEGMVLVVEDLIGNMEHSIIKLNQLNTIICDADFLTGLLVVKPRTFIGNTLHTLAWPFRQIGKLF